MFLNNSFCYSVCHAMMKQVVNACHYHVFLFYSIQKNSISHFIEFMKKTPFSCDVWDTKDLVCKYIGIRK